MSYTIDLPSRTYKSWVGDFTVTQNIKRNGNQIKTNFEIISSEHQIDNETDWIDYPPANMMSLIEKTAKRLVFQGYVQYTLFFSVVMLDIL